MAGLDLLVSILVWAVVVFIIAYIAFYLIKQFVPEPFKTPGLLIVGAIVLIAVLYMLLGALPMRGLR